MSRNRIYSKLSGTGGYLPETIINNDYWTQWVDTTDEWIYTRTGIRERHFALKDETAAGMGVQAARKALSMAGISPGDVEMIIVTTGTPDRLCPSCACTIQKELGVPLGRPAFDLQVACSGFIYAMSIADQFIQSAHVKNVLIVSTELLSRLIDWSDRNTCILFGDGAGAVLLEASKEPGIIKTTIGADGYKGDLLTLDNMQLVDYQSPEKSNNLNRSLNSVNPYIQIQGQSIFKLAVQYLSDLLDDCKEPIDWVIPHQANVRVIQAIAKKLNLSIEQVVSTIDIHSNTASASIPLALDLAIRDGRIQRGQNLFLEAFGAGLTWGSCVIKY